MTTPSFDRAIRGLGYSVQTIAAARALTAADIGSIIRYTGTAAGAMPLPAVVLGNGSPVYIKNLSNFTLTLDPGTVGGVPRSVNGVVGPAKLLAKQEGEFVFDGVSSWETKNIQKRVQIAKTVTTALQTTIPFFLPPDYEQFDFRLKAVQPASGTDGLIFRLATDAAGTAFNASANYYRGNSFNTSGAVTAGSANSETIAYLALSVFAGGPDTFDMNLTPGGDLNNGNGGNPNWIWKGGWWQGSVETGISGGGFLAGSAARATGIQFSLLGFGNLQIGATVIIEGLA